MNTKGGIGKKKVLPEVSSLKCLIFPLLLEKVEFSTEKCFRQIEYVRIDVISFLVKGTTFKKKDVSEVSFG